jgi:hypothetical protein
LIRDSTVGTGEFRAYKKAEKLTKIDAFSRFRVYKDDNILDGIGSRKRRSWMASLETTTRKKSKNRPIWRFLLFIFKDSKVDGVN